MCGKRERRGEWLEVKSREERRKAREGWMIDMLGQSEWGVGRVDHTIYCW